MEQEQTTEHRELDDKLLRQEAELAEFALAKLCVYKPVLFVHSQP